jgi:hypothetical protein
VGNCFFQSRNCLTLICIIPLAQVGEHQESLLAYLGHTQLGGSGLPFQSMLFWYYVVLF